MKLHQSLRTGASALASACAIACGGPAATNSAADATADGTTADAGSDSAGDQATDTAIATDDAADASQPAADAADGASADLATADLPPADVPPAGPTLFINEIAAAGVTNGDFNPSKGDWAEIYNAGKSPVDLSGYVVGGLDKGFDGAKTNVPPQVLAAGSSAPPGYLIIYFNHLGPSYGTPFIDNKLKKDGSMALWKPDGTLVDSVDWNDGDSPNSQSWGRSPDGAKVFKTFATPTPGKPNN